MIVTLIMRALYHISMSPHDQLENHFRLLEPQKRALKKLGLFSVGDLLRHFPVRYENAGEQKTILGLVAGQEAVLFGKIGNLETRKTWKSRRPIAEATLEDGTGRIKIMWFNQPYIAKMIAGGTLVKVSGAVSGKEGKLYLANPEIEQIQEMPQGGVETIFGARRAAAPENYEEDDTDNALYAIYPETIGITSRWFRHAIARAIRAGAHRGLSDPIPEDIRARYHLPSLETALVFIHAPKKENDARAARKRFAFEEVFVIQTAKMRAQEAHNKEPALGIPIEKKSIDTFIARFPFHLTRGQESAIDAILKDISAPPAMARLLEGDVGSGKTAIAATTAYAVVMTPPPLRIHGNLQVAYMAPTEILAEQHFQSFIELFKHLPVQIGLITSSGCKKFPSKVNPSGATTISRAQLLKWVANGEIPILIGTHALIQKSVQFKNLAYVIIDEQHRFGTGQRGALIRKDGYAPHLLSMTATPIPRTLALTIYGDLDLTVLDEMPAGRKRVITEIITKEKRALMYERVHRELTSGRQAYVICPRIDEPDPQKANALQTRSAKAEAARLARQEFHSFNVGILHGQMKPAEKDEAMRAFLAHETDVLVATSVVEVGVNVPNATVIIIEGAERFGLAQLHQLRGRVVRSNEQAYCFALTTSGAGSARLRAFVSAKNGFELAELDLKLRGPGELYGRMQSGLSDVGMEALKNLKLVEAARSEAARIVKEDASLLAYPALAEAVGAKMEKLHFE